MHVPELKNKLKTRLHFYFINKITQSSIQYKANTLNTL